MENISIETLIESIDVLLDTIIDCSLHNIQMNTPDDYKNLSCAKRQLADILLRYRESQNQIKQLQMQVNLFESRASRAEQEVVNLRHEQIRRY